MPTRSTSPGKARIGDVARAAGVSVGTVSKALNGTGSLKQETRDRVQSVADRLGFVADPRGRGLSQGRSYTVGFLTTDSFGRFSMPILMGAEDALAVGKMAVILSDTRDDYAREQHLLRSLHERRVDGLIITNRPQGISGPLTSSIPTVYTFDTPDSPDELAVVSDRAHSITLAVEHLLALGRTRLLHISGPLRARTAPVKAAAVRDAAGDHLVQPSMHGTWSEAWGRRAVDIAIASGVDFDGICCDSDQIARGALERLRAHGRSIPEDVAITGFGNWDAMVDATVPGLTSIDQDLTEIGRLAGTLLLDVLEGREVADRQIVVPSQIVVRGSTI
ncbi:LacI family transcriptional regulator [Brachybacterium ginsengisoli]|uniref:LacI family transcriptional regulator n=1 Tax=Brachybacterium ginsengisoli TaxID=1331682 RepID=A0A291GTP5_9MICO|nr:LacI family DNA-binding transcriptional regulator [Brachybacterium ginsengisoli]ATG53589.1 LacI family transcriptional regulator [Brachybacterium ginsengisoli]